MPAVDLSGVSKVDTFIVERCWVRARRAMTWFAWRQIRSQLIVAAIALLILGIVLGDTGHSLGHLFQSTVATCTRYQDCPGAQGRFLQHASGLQGFLGFVMICVPGLLGLFLGAPLLGRELETGTFRLVWSQSVTRTRWLLTKLACSALGVTIVAGLLTLMVTWWSTYFDRLNATPFTSFDKRGIVEIGYALFALMLGAFLGLVIRRTLPAMAVTFVGFAAVRTVVSTFVRQRLLPVSHVTVPDTLIAAFTDNPTTGPKGDWVLADRIINGSGKVIGKNGVIGNGDINTTWNQRGLRISNVGSCPNIRPQNKSRAPLARFHDSIQKCVHQLRIRDVLTYQPAHHYWPLQWMEFGLFSAMAIVLAGLSLWWVRRRIV